jgi:hypothetical protein
MLATRIAASDDNLAGDFHAYEHVATGPPVG